MWEGRAVAPHLRRPTRPPLASSPLPFLSAPLRRLALCVFLSQGWDQPPLVRGREEVQDRLAAALVGEEVPDLEAVLTSPRLSSHLYPQDFLPALPERARLEEVLPRLCPVFLPVALNSAAQRRGYMNSRQARAFPMQPSDILQQ